MDGLSLISLLVGVIGTGIAIYQTAVLNESKKRKGELQYLLAGINSSALQKQQLWQNQISLIQHPLSETDIEIAKVSIRARDDFTDIANLTVALEGAIDPDSSAITSMMDKYIETVRKNNILQAEAQNNPSQVNESTSETST
ncbi:hypothetical protein ACROAE_18500 [Shewanella sp. MF05960]|uniref:hypothetical protein n=1 Tax=Shewanella sp. MF05960 TaxID=3434874 RepID=UPI003D7AF147